MSTSQTVSKDAVYNVRGDQNAQGEWTQHVRVTNDFAPAAYDVIELGYTGTDLTTVTYKLAGDVVAILTLVYDGSHVLQSVTRS